MTNRAHSGVICTDCGHPGAVIKVIDVTRRDEWQTKYTVTLEHDLCAYTENLHPIIQEIFRSHQANEVTFSGLESRILNISTSEDNLDGISEAIKAIKQFSADFFEKINVTITTTPSKLICPVCHGDHFVVDGQNMSCVQSHFRLSIPHYLHAKMTSLGYEVKADTYQNKFTISTVFPAQKRFLHDLIWGENADIVLPTAELEYRATSSQDILLFESLAQDEREFSAFFQVVSQHFAIDFQLIIKNKLNF